MNTTNNNKSGGIGFAGLLTVTFITLKLCNVIAWSWWWVLSPIWISIGLVIGILLIFAVGAILLACFKKPETPEQKASRLFFELAARSRR
jgi:hypothetical protein